MLRTVTQQLRSGLSRVPQTRQEFKLKCIKHALVPRSVACEGDVNAKRSKLEVAGVAKNEDDVPKKLFDPNGIEVLTANGGPYCRAD